VRRPPRAAAGQWRCGARGVVWTGRLYQATWFTGRKSACRCRGRPVVVPAGCLLL